MHRKTTAILAILGLISIVFTILYAINNNEYELIFYSLIVYKIFGLLANQISLHRYLGHGSFTTGKWRHALLVWISIFIGQGSPLRVVSVHRCHHKYSDTLEDVHSPLNNSWLRLFWYTFESKEWAKMKKMIIPKDLVRDKQIMFIHDNYSYIWIFIILVSLLISWKLTVFYVLANVGWNVLHVTLFRVILIHTKLPGSYRNFNTSDYSWNNKLIVLLDIGEGLHNNHHMYPNKYDQAMAPGEFDPAGWVIKHFFDINYKKNVS